MSTTTNFEMHELAGDLGNVSFDPYIEHFYYDGLPWIDSTVARNLADFIYKSLNMSVPNFTTREEWNLTTFTSAMKLEFGVKFTYAASESDAVQVRTLSEVDSIVTTSKGDKLVIGYDDDRSEVRSFRIDRVKGYVQINA